MRLDYFVSPMCSWCWGFSPVINQIRATLSSEIEINLVLTPFRVDTVDPMDMKLRNYVLGQWKKVHQTTGQPFDFEFRVPKDFIYNTKLACLAIKSFEQQLHEKSLAYLTSLQEAFYTRNLDLTRLNSLLEVAKSFPIDVDQLKYDIASNEIGEKVKEDFKYCKQAQINSYPSVLAVTDKGSQLLVNGYTPFKEVEKRTMKWIYSSTCDV